MDIINLIRRTLHVIWTKKYLMVLGTVFVIVTRGVRLQDMLIGPVLKPLLELCGVPNAERLPLADYVWFIRFLVWISEHGIVGWIGLIIGTLLVAIMLGIVAIVARGALIASAGETETPINWKGAIKAGWRKAWRLLIIASIPPIPVTVAAILIVILAAVVILQVGGVDALSRSADLQQQVGGGLMVASMVILFPFFIATYILALLSTLAERACVLEDRQVFESYRRGWEILRANFVPAALLALLHIVIETLIGPLLTVPEILSMFCLVLMPLVWIVGGIEISFFITLWTLAWCEWATVQPATELVQGK
ncbi:MAG: hypothetical protein JXB07_14010 [Anaerolineae bacterium]|nr:hypothetical protein [Anaerolineae bacterium]